MTAALQTVGSLRQERHRQWKGRRTRPLQASRWRYCCPWLVPIYLGWGYRSSNGSFAQSVMETSNCGRIFGVFIRSLSVSCGTR